jgi:hypothetical protein
MSSVNEPPKNARDAVNKIFGDALPELPSDEREKFSPDDEAEHDRWLRDNMPPHHQ